jgi:hypothetical protein
MCNKPKRLLKGTNALKYIEAGEREKVVIRSGGRKDETVIGYHNLETLSNRKEWWTLGIKRPSKINCNYLVNDLMRCYYSDRAVYAIDNFQQVHPSNIDYTKLLCAILNSTLFALFTNIEGRANFGGGLMKMQTYEIRNTLVVDPGTISTDLSKKIEAAFDRMASRDLGTIFEECGLDQSKPISEQDPKPLADRKALDEILFDLVGLGEEERKEIYVAVCELVRLRLDKAKSLKEDLGPDFA